MAESGQIETYTMKAAGDLSAAQYHVMRDLGDGTTDIASDDTSTAMIGVLQNKPKATGRAASIAYLGPSKVVAGGTVTRGALLTCNGSGRAADAGSGDMVFGRALAAAGADGEVVPALVFPPFKL